MRAMYAILAALFAAGLGLSACDQPEGEGGGQQQMQQQQAPQQQQQPAAPQTE